MKTAGSLAPSGRFGFRSGRLPSTRRAFPFALDRAPADIVAMELAVPVDLPERGVGLALRLGDVVAERAHAQHAAAGGQRFAVRAELGAGLEDFRVRGLRRVQAWPATCAERGR